MKRRSARAAQAWGDHVPDGTDAQGDGLPVTIRIAPDGRVYFHDITERLVSVALAMNPEDEAMRERKRVLNAFSEGEST
jgi:hypothetical protein